MTEEHTIHTENIPFEESEKYNFLQGLYLSILLLIRSPRIFFDRMHINKGLKYPIIFVLIMLAVNTLFTGLYINTGLITSPAEQLQEVVKDNPGFIGDNNEFLDQEIKDPSFADLIKNIALNLLLFFLFAWVWHFSLSIAGASPNGFEATFRALAYSMVTSIVAIIPLNNPFMNFLIYIWWIYLIYVGITEAHEVSKKLAVRGMILSLIFSFFLLVLVFSIAM